MASLQQTGFESGLRQTTVVTVLLAACLVSAAFAESHKEYRFTVGPNARVSVDTQFGAVSVRPGSADQVVVLATLKTDKVEVDQQQNGNRIEIASHLLPGSSLESGQIDYELLVPPDATVNVRSASGPISAEHLQGDLTLEGPDAMIDVRDVKNAHVHVRTMRGPITLTEVGNGHVEIESISGDLHMNDVTGPLVQATSSSGKIFYDGNFGSDGNYKFTTHTGDIVALVPANVSADFKAHSMLGRVQHDFPLKAQQHSYLPPDAGRSFFGTMGQAASEVVLRSFSGRIRLKQR